ncbi:MAG TPA: NAD-dependent epimerase/dehydratase family protein [Dehalococcoidia bacterium]|nr:NAD-dependent epimerase/dehydratase family protein [Dehalococcoidia bacterium]
MKVLVTGATGFVGGNLARKLWEQGHEVMALVRPGSIRAAMEGTGIQSVTGDILDRDSVDRAVQGCEAVFHCAAAYTFWSPDPDAIYRTNVDGTVNVLKAARQAGVSRVVYTSTVSTIGLPDWELSTEETLADPNHLAGHYKKSKYQAELAALDMVSQGLPVIVVNPTTPVGPWDVKPTPTGRMVLDFLLGRIPAYVDTGMNLVDVEDVAEGHILAMERGQPGQRYLLGNRNVSLKEVFDMLADATGLAAPKWRAPYWLVMGAGYVDELVEGRLLKREPRIPLEGLKVSKSPMYVSCQKAITELGQPQSSVEEALQKAINWFRDYGYTKDRAGKIKIPAA